MLTEGYTNSKIYHVNLDKNFKEFLDQFESYEYIWNYIDALVKIKSSLRGKVENWFDRAEGLCYSLSISHLTV